MMPSLPKKNKYIFTGFMPNSLSKDIQLACRYLLSPVLWNTMLSGSWNARVISSLETIFSKKDIYLVDSGRSALYLGLRGIDIQPGDHVLVQAYTCIVVINAILFTGAIPIYVDVLDDATMDPTDIQKKITDKTKAIIIQHTFGKPARMKEIMAIAKEYGLITIEDCAHTFLATYQGKKLGTMADIAIFSFGSDKMISCVRGGAILVNNPAYRSRIHQLCTTLLLPSRLETMRHLHKYWVFYIGKTYYAWGGKYLLYIANIVGLTSPIMTKGEKRNTEQPEPTTLANALAHILYQQIEAYPAIEIHRKRITTLYHQQLPETIGKKPEISAEYTYVRYPLMSTHMHTITPQAKKNRILLGDWYTSVIAPKGDLIRMYYTKGSCPNAERLTLVACNLPTDISISEQDAKRIIHTITNTCIV